MTGKKHFTTEEAKRIGEALGIDWSKFNNAGVSGMKREHV